MVGRNHRARAGHILHYDVRLPRNVLWHMLGVQARPQVIHITGEKPDYNLYGFALIEFVCSRIRRTGKKNKPGDHHRYNGPNDLTHNYSLLGSGPVLSRPRGIVAWLHTSAALALRIFLRLLLRCLPTSANGTPFINFPVRRLTFRRPASVSSVIFLRVSSFVRRPLAVARQSPLRASPASRRLWV